MKKVVSLLLVSALLIGALSACKRNEPEPEPAPPEPVTPTYDYQDGEYAVSYAVPALDRTLDYLTISIKNDEITIVEAGCKEDVSLPAPSEETSGDAASAPTEPGRAVGTGLLRRVLRSRPRRGIGVRGQSQRPDEGHRRRI